MIIDEIFEAPQQCPKCGGISFSDLILAEKKDACYHKVKASAKVWPSAYASGRLVQCRKKGAANYGNKSEGVAEGVPQPGPSSGAPKQFGSDAKIQTRQMTVKDIISSIPGVPYYNNVVDDWDAKDYGWGVTKKVIEYATYLKDHPESLAKLPPAIVLNGKFEDGAHRVSAIWLLQQRMDPKNPLWKNAKLNVQFVQQGVAEDNLNELDMFAPVTTYVRLANGTYVAANWRRNQNLSTASNSASFIDIKPLAPNVAKQLGLDQRLNDPEKKYTGATTIASGGPIQASGPLADRTINVVDIRDPKAAKDSGVPDTLFGKISQWAQQQGQKQPGVAEATGDEKFDTMMGQMQREPTIPDPQMPPTDVKDLYQWAVKNNKPYHKIFAEWANREGYKSVAPALQKAGNLDSDALDYWTPRVWEIYWGEVRGIDSEMPPEWAKKRIPDELRDYLDTVFDAYDRIVFDWPTEYRQIGQQGVAETRRGQIPMTLKPGETDNLEPEDFAGFKKLPAYQQGQAAQQKAGKQLIQKSPYTFQSDQDWAYRQGATDAQRAAMFANFGGTKPLTTAEGEQQPGADYRDPNERDYDGEYDAMVARVKRLAGLGPMKTVYDPTKRVYRNMPTAQQPKKQ